MDTNITVDEIYKLLANDDKYHLRKLIDSQIPSNDYEYINLWYTYFSLMLDEVDIIENYFQSWATEPGIFKFRYDLVKKIRNCTEKIFNEKLNAITFQPRINKYLEKFDVNEREFICKLILSLFFHSAESSYSGRKTLQKLGQQFDIKPSFLYSITEEHSLFKDRIFYVGGGLLDENQPLLSKELNYKPAVYKLFAGLKLTDADIASIGDSPLLLDFHIIGEEYLQETQGLNEDLGLVDLEEEEFESIEDLLKQSDKETEQQIKPKEKLREEDKSEITPFTDDLDYIHEESKWIQLLLQLREKQNEPDFKRNNENIFEIEQQLKKQKNLCMIRLNKTKMNGFIPRVEKISSKLKLSDFERNVIKVLTIVKIFPFSSTNHFWGATGSFQVGQLLNLFIDDVKERVREKRSFLRNSKLVKYNLIQVSRINSLNETIHEATISIDNRLLEFLGGEDFDFSDYFEGGLLYKSKIKFDSVILSESKKNKIIEILDNFPLFLKAKKNLDFSDIVNYGNSLVLLFVGPSGTGKTMTANAISEYLNKKILTINLNQGLSVPDNYYSNTSSILALIFREARINDAILFFDESEALLNSRLPDILLEIEKHEGVVIFATNASFKIDDAMRRRINLILDFEEPGPSQRKRIWEIHLPRKIKLNADVDLDYLAKKYELNGGLIKNAVFSSLAYAINQTKGCDLEIGMEALEYGAKEQLQNKLFMSRLEEKRVPLRGIESLILPEATINTIKEIINFEKAKKVLEGEWGFKDIFPESSGTTVLFHGASGSGKTITAEAIAFETGKTLKIVNYAQVISMYVGGTEKALETLLKQSADNDSILLFDEADSLFAKRTDIRTSNDRYANLETDVLLNLIERNNVFAILTTNHFDVIDTAFFRRMKFIVEFKNPDFELRLQLWRRLLPPKLPVAEDVNFEKLARDYNFNGGDIKNAIIKSATRQAINIEGKQEVDMLDFIDACNEINKFKLGNKLEKIGFEN